MSSSASRRIAIVDDDPFMLRILAAWARSRNFESLRLSSGLELLRADLNAVVAVFLDLNLGDVSGLDVLRHVKARDPHLPIIVISSARQLDTAIEAMRMGAHDYLTKPIDMQRLDQALLTLPEQQRSTFVLGELLGLSTEQIAEIEGCPAATVRSRLSRARAALLNALAGSGGTP